MTQAALQAITLLTMFVMLGIGQHKLLRALDVPSIQERAAGTLDCPSNPSLHGSRQRALRKWMRW